MGNPSSAMISSRHFPSPAEGPSADGKPSALSRKSSTRISAKEGSLILEKYIRKRASQDEESNDGKLHAIVCPFTLSIFFQDLITTL